MHRVISGLVFVGFGVVLASCGGGGNTFTAAKGNLSLTQATALKGLSGNQSPTGAVAATPGSASGVLPSITTRGTFDSCTTNTPETTTDADSDGIPATQTTTFACNDITASSRQFTRRQVGTRTITDKDDADVAGGYKYEYAMSGDSSSTSGFNSTYNYNGVFEFTRTAGTARSIGSTWSYTSNFKGESAGSGGGHDDYDTTWGQSFTSTFSQTGRGEGDDRAFSGTGTAEIGGFWGYKGTINDNRTSQEIDVVFRLRSSGLTWATSCTGFYNGGSLTFVDAGQNELTYTWSACGSLVITYNGRTI